MDGMFDCTVRSATSTGVAVAIALNEKEGRTTSRLGSENDDGNAPSCPVSAAARSPARNAGRIGGTRVPNRRWLRRYAARALPTMSGTSAGMRTPSWLVLSDVKMFTTNGITAPAIRPLHDRCGDPGCDPAGEPEEGRRQHDRARHHRGAGQLREPDPIPERREEDDREDVPREEQGLAIPDASG